MLELKYFRKYWLNTDLFKFVSFLYLIPLFVLLFYNLTENYQGVYNYIKLLDYSSFKYIVYSDESSFDFYKIRTYIKANYSEELSVAGQKYYKNNSLVDLYICTDGTLLARSYFNEKNLLKSINYDHSKGYPIYISHDLSFQLDADCNDVIYFEYDTISVPFVIAGVLRPSYDIDNVLKSRDGIVNNVCAIIPEGIMEQLLDLNNEAEYIKFTDAINTDDNYLSKEGLKETLMKYLMLKENMPVFIYGSVATLFILILIVIIEFNFTIKRSKKDISIFMHLGIKKKNIQTIMFLIVSSKFLFSFINAVLLSKFILFDRILFIYIDFTFILISSAIFITLIILTVFIRCIYTSKI